MTAGSIRVASVEAPRSQKNCAEALSIGAEPLNQVPRESKYPMFKVSGPTNNKGMVSGIRDLKHWVLGPSGVII